MKIKNISSFDVKFYFKRNKAIYFMFLFCFFVGIVLGFIVMLSSDNYLKLLTTENKILYPFINGTAETAVLFWKKLLAFFMPLLLLFVLGLNYYSSLLSYIFITYQSTLLMLSCGAIVKTYGFSGFFNVLLITLPINLIYFCVLIFFAATCILRSKVALKNKLFKYGFDEMFFLKTMITLVAILLLCIIVCVVYPLFLRNTIFIVF